MADEKVLIVSTPGMEDGRLAKLFKRAQDESWFTVQSNFRTIDEQGAVKQAAFDDLTEGAWTVPNFNSTPAPKTAAEIMDDIKTAIASAAQIPRRYLEPRVDCADAEIKALHDRMGAFLQSEIAEQNERMRAGGFLTISERIARERERIEHAKAAGLVSNGSNGAVAFPFANPIATKAIQGGMDNSLRLYIEGLRAAEKQKIVDQILAVDDIKTRHERGEEISFDDWQNYSAMMEGLAPKERDEILF